MRVAIVNDMIMALESLRRIVASHPDHQVAWTAQDGGEAVKRCSEDIPDLILMDLIMPDMNGVEATRRIMANTPCPILVVTASVTENAAMVFEAMGAGALDAISTPILGPSGEGEGKDALLAKIRMIGRLARADRSKTAAPAPASTASVRTSNRWLLALGSSTGGPNALMRILSRLPRDLPAPVVIVQHVDQNFTVGLADWLNNQSTIPVRLAHEGDALEVGTVYVAGTNNHLHLKKNGHLGYTPDPLSIVYRPSVDVFFNSVAENWSGHVVAALLTGMGRDGAEGLLHLRRGGAHTIAQDRATCAVYGMPKAAAELNAAVEVLPIDEIAHAAVRKILA